MDLQQFLSTHSVPCKQEGEHHHARSGWIQVDCPFCSKGSGRYRLGINLSHGYCNCWICGSRRLVEVMVALTGITYPVAYALAKEIGWSKKPQERIVGKLKIPKAVGPLWEPHRKYLLERGFDPDEIERLWKVKGIGISSDLAWRLWIPIINRGEIVSWTTRTIGHDHPRYINASPGEESERQTTLLYGIDYVRHSVVVCEGPTDVWAIGPGAVCTMGLGYSQEQMLKIARIPRRAMCFDRESMALKRARRLASELMSFEGETSVIELDHGGDPASTDRKEIKEIREKFLE